MESLMQKLLFYLAVFAVFALIGYGSGYGINEKVTSNKAVVPVSSSKNGAYNVDLVTFKTSKQPKPAVSFCCILLIKCIYFWFGISHIITEYLAG